MLDPHREIHNNEKKYRYPTPVKCPTCKGTGKSKKYICRSCGKTHQWSHNYVLCEIQQRFNRKIDKPLPGIIKQGTRREWVKDYYLIRNFNWSLLVSRIVERDGSICKECKSKRHRHDEPLEVHHIIPKSNGGSDHPANLKTLCKKCHLSKHLK